MEDFGLVSIITASYNCSDYIAATIESIQDQSYKNWELLITDDCSTDNSVEVISEYARTDPRIKLFRLPENSGAGVARNNSIKEACGRFIAFCDSDDRWKPEKLTRQLRFMTEHGHHLTFSSYDTCDENGIANGYVECLKKINYLKILRDNGIGCLTAIYDSEKIGKHYMPQIRKRQDWCLWIDIIRKHGPAYGLQEPLALYRVRSGSISRNKISLLKYNFDVYNKVLNFNKPLSAVLLGAYFLPYYLYKKNKQKRDYKKLTIK